MRISRGRWRIRQRQKRCSGTTRKLQLFEALGKATVDLFEAVLVRKIPKVITDFMMEIKFEMVKEVTPFITRHVIPRCIEIKK